MLRDLQRRWPFSASTASISIAGAANATHLRTSSASSAFRWMRYTKLATVGGIEPALEYSGDILSAENLDALFVTAVAAFLKRGSRNAESYYAIQVRDMNKNCSTSIEASGL
jgi:hypothetical protein